MRPIVLQIENEYGNIQGQYGAAGNEYVKWAAQMALELGAGVPWTMCQQEDAPTDIVRHENIGFSLSIVVPIDYLFFLPIFRFFLPNPQINTCNAFYCDRFSPNAKNKPKLWTENWNGW